MKNWKPVLLWTHLVTGLVAGTVIFYLSVTGLLLAFKPQIIEASRSGLVRESSAAALPLAAVLEKAAAGSGELNADLKSDLKSITIWKENPGYIELQFGREKKLYSAADGKMLQENSGWNSFFESTTNLHRWFSTKNEGDHKVQKSIKGLCMILFIMLVVSGMILWFPGGTYKLNLKLKNKARNWNLHNVFGFWMAPVILLISVTGLIMAHQWANNLLFLAVGSELPAPPKKEESPKKAEEFANVKKVTPAQLAQMIAEAQAKTGNWNSLTARVEKGLVRINIEEIIGLNLTGRSQLHFNAESGQEVFWEPYESLSLGRKIRSSMHPIHTGEAAGFLGQLLVSLGALTAMLLVWTGFAMSYRRFVKPNQLKGRTS